MASSLSLKSSSALSARLFRSSLYAPRRHVSKSSSASSPQSTVPRRASLDRPSFPCVEQHAARSDRLLASFASHSHNPTCSSAPSPYHPATSSGPSTDPSTSGPEPPYARPSPKSYQTFTCQEPLSLTYYPNEPLAKFTLAYETWGTLSPKRDNVILLHTGLSASSHAASTSTNPAPGWWEKFIGPGLALDTNQFFVVCTNVLGGCYGSSGPSTVNPQDPEGKPYATRFPVMSIFDMVRAQWKLLDEMRVEKLYASVGCSMGAMQSLAAAYLEPDRVGKVVSISGTARSTPSSIAMRYAQRSVLMADPNWNNGFYYDGLPPHAGLKLARQIATITYRSGPEWDLRFGRQMRAPLTSPNGEIREPALCPDFLIETYLDHQGEQFCLKYDPNSLIYVSKAMDLFDMTASSLSSLNIKPNLSLSSEPSSSQLPPASPRKSYLSPVHTHSKLHPPPSNPPPYLEDLAEGLRPLAKMPALVLGVQSDILFTVEQQRELADALRMGGNERVSYYELGGVWGHDTFLLDVQNVGGAIRGFLS